MTKTETEIRDSPIIAQRKKSTLHCCKSLYLIHGPILPSLFSHATWLEPGQLLKVVLNSKLTSNDLAKSYPSILIPFSKIASMLTKDFKFVLFFPELFITLF